jgi:predicted Zn-dependent protease with MMP-like domain
MARRLSGFAPDIEDISRLAEQAFRALPEALLRHARDVVIRVEDFPDAETMETMELDTPFDLLGLYRGVDLPRRSVLDSGRLPDIVHLYRRPILDEWCESGERLEDIVRNVLVHEIGHHFGFSDEEMEALEEEE